MRAERSVLTRARRWAGRSRAAWLGLGAVAGAGLLLAAGYLLPLVTDTDRLEPGEIVIMADRDQSLGSQRHRLIAEWNLANPEHPARLEEVPASATAARSQLVAHAQSGAGGVDIYSLDVTWTAEFAAAGLIRPLAESRLETGGFLAAPLATGAYEGRQYALPFNTDAGLLYYRRDLVAEPPTSWAGLVSEVERVFANDPPPELVAGYAGQFGDYEGLTVNALEAIWAAGGDVVVGPEQVAPLAEFRPGIQALADGLAPREPQVILPESRDFDERRSTQAFQHGQVLFMRNWPVAYRYLTAATDDDRPALSPEQVGIARLPGPSVLGGQNLAVAGDSPRPRAAQRLIEFLTDPRSQQKLFEHGGFAPTREIVYHDRSVDPAEHPYLDPLLASLHEARPRPVTRSYEQFSGEFRAAVSAALANGGELHPETEQRLGDALRGYRRG